MDHNSYVGILVSDLFHSQIPSGRTGQEDLSLYEEACKLYGMKPCYVRIRDLNAGRAFIYAYVKRKGRYWRCRIPYPWVIHNRAIFKNPASNRALMRLIRNGVHVFNARNRYSKLDIHQLLLQEPGIAPHLPETFGANWDTIQEMMIKYPSLLIKPVSGSIGRGIMRLQELEDRRWELSCPSLESGKWIRTRFSSKLPSVLKLRLRNGRYLVQQQVSLACYKDSPFDLRVSVQRGEDGEWGITGIVGKVARRGSFLTNVAQGGRTYPLDVLLADMTQLNLEEVTARIHTLSLDIARCLSGHLPGLADLGLDIGITDEGWPMFIEANGRDQRYSFRKAGMLEEWKATYRNPMAYGHFLSKGIKSP
jgi:hypothetical protein